MTELAGCVDGRYYPGVRGTYIAIPGDHLERYLWAASIPEAQGGVVDAGCGAGYGCTFFPAARMYLGMDLSDEAIGYARECYGNDMHLFTTWNLADVPWPAADADLVVAFEVIEHLWPKDWPAMMAGAHGILRPGGVLCMSCPVETVGIDLGGIHTRHPEEQEVLGLLKGFQVETILRNGSGMFGLHEGAQDGGRWTLFVKARRM